MNREHMAAQLILRSWPFPRGAGRLIDRFFSSLNFQERETTVQTTDGFPITVTPNDLIGRHIYLTGEFDRTIVEVLKRFALPSDTLLDIGANIGYVSACFLATVPDSKVISIEPQPALVEILRKNLSQFPGRHLIEPFAISSRDGEGQIDGRTSNPGAGRLIDAPSEGSIPVKLKSADSLFAGIGKIDLVKIDVEGHETEIFRAAKEHLRKHAPRAIVFEDHRGANAGPSGAIGSLLGEIGYQVFGIEKHLTRIRLIPNTERVGFNDYVAINSRS